MAPPAALLAAAAAAAGGDAPSGLLMDWRAAPHRGVDRPRPTVGWVVPHIADCGANQMQAAFQVQASSSPHFDTGGLLSDTGKRAAPHSTVVPWPGADLLPLRTYWWRVRTWATAGCASNWSAPAKVITGHFGGGFASAKPVWADGARYALLRKEVALRAAPVVSAHVYVTAAQDGPKEKLIGAYRLYLNGAVVGTGPGRGETAYSDPGHTPYDTLDVTAEVTAAAAAGGTLAVAMQGFHHAGDSTARAAMELHVSYGDGSEQVVPSDASWSARNADKVFNPTDSTRGDFGSQPREYIDARHSEGGCQTCWRAKGFRPGAGWVNATERAAFAPPPAAKRTLPVQVLHVDPQRIVEVGPGHWFVDFGSEVMAGAVLSWEDGAAGEQLDLRFSEELTGDTSVMSPMRTGNLYQMGWTLGDGLSSFEQHEYFLFRYGEIRHTTAGAWQCAAAEEGALRFSCPQGKVITDIVSVTHGAGDAACGGSGGCAHAEALALAREHCNGRGSCAVPSANLSAAAGCGTRLHGAARCTAPARSSLRSSAPPFNLSAWAVRYPWVESDSSFASDSAMLNRVWELCRNTLRATSLDTWTDSNTRERLPYEGDGLVSGAARYVFQREYAWQRHSLLHNARNPTWPTEWRQVTPMIAANDYMMTGDTEAAAALGGILDNATQARCIDPASGVVDFTHCPRLPGTRDIIDWPQGSRDGYVLSDATTVVSAYAVGALRAMALLAGNSTRAGELSRQADALAAATAGRYFDNATGLFADGEGTAHSAWHAQVFPLYFGVSNTSDARLFAFLKERGMVGSVYAAYFFLLGLYNAESDLGALALQMMTDCGDNSWCHMLQVGATATMEAWTRKEKPNLSWSHPWATAPAAAIAHGVMGIRPSAAGWSRFRVRPQLGALRWARIRLPAAPGFIEAAANRTDTDFTLQLSPPANTVAEVCLPRMGSAARTLTLDGAPTAGRLDGEFVCLEGVGSGKHTVRRAAA